MQSTVARRGTLWLSLSRPRAARTLPPPVAAAASSARCRRAFSELLARMETFGDRLALQDRAGTWSYRQLLAASRRLASAAGPLPRSEGQAARVAYLCPRDHSYVIAQLAAWQAGAVCVPLADTHPVEELKYFIEDAAPAVLYAAREHAAAAAELARSTGVRVVIVDSPTAAEAAADAAPGAHGEAAAVVAASAEAVAAAADAVTAAASEDPEGGAMIIYTSGTTSKPKGVLTSRRALRGQIRALTRAWEWSASDRILHVLPLHHVHGVMAVLLCALWSGAAVELSPRFAAAAAYAALARPRGAADALTLFMAVPTVYAKLLQHHEAQEAGARARWGAALRAGGGLRLMVSGSAALPEPLMRAWAAASGATLLERFGMTELGMALSNPLHASAEAPRQPSSVGRPLPGYEARLVDEGGAVLPAGASASGELHVRGAGVFSGYWRRPEATAAEMTADGWFRTGDSAHRDARGYFYIDGRLSADILKSGGYKLSALEIERHLLERASVAEVAVFGVPHDVWGEEVVALVVPQGAVAAALGVGAAAAAAAPTPPAPAAGALALIAGAPAAAAAAELRAWAKTAMAGYKVPSSVRYVAELPRNAMGKVNKKTLKAAYLAALARETPAPAA